MRTISRGVAAGLVFCVWASAQAQVAPMLNLVVIEGEGAINNVRQRTAREPIVQVEDSNHRPVAGAIVTFTLPGRGASGVFANGSQTMTVTTKERFHRSRERTVPSTPPNRVSIRSSISVLASAS